MDFILNGQAHGEVASLLQLNGWDPGALRPFIGNDGRSYVTLHKNGKAETIPMTNANATLRKDDWKLLDTAIIKAAKPRLRLVADLRGAGLQFTIPNGMGRTVLEHETQSDISEAKISMDATAEGLSDRPEFGLEALPLPIIHKRFQFSARQLAVSRNGGSPLDTTTAELAGRRVAEFAEQLAIGSQTFGPYGGGTVYGITNFPSRITKSMTLPTASGWTGATLVAEVLSMQALSRAKYHYGPWLLYNSPNWDAYLDADYSASKGDNTLRERIGKIEGITGPRTLDYLSGYQMILVQQSTDVIREVIGMDITTLQWPSMGGLVLNFMVMAIMVPQLRKDHNGNTGIVHGTAS